MGEEVLKHDLVDGVIYVPTGDKYAKEELIKGFHRCNMLRLMGVEVSNYEIVRGASYTFETLDYFQEQYPDAEISFIMSTDLILDIEKWKNPEYILTNYKIIGIKRKGIEVENLPAIYELYPGSLTMHDFDLEELSSTMIREKIKKNDKNLTKYLDPKVLEYINVNELYK